MEPDDTIGKITISLREIQSEHEIYQIINSSLIFLRGLYRKNRMAFSEDQIDYLKSVAKISQGIEKFIDLKEFIDKVVTVQSYVELHTEFNDLKNQLNNYAICNEIKKAIRHLRNRIPEINRYEQKQREENIMSKIYQLEQKQPYCPRGHPMIIRDGEFGHFWGCTKFPQCFQTKQLNKSEKDYLYS